MTRSIAWMTTALALGLALPAGAQTSGQSGQEGQAPAAGQRTADQMTCADIATMDTAVVPGTLYFIAGYQEGRGMGMGQGQDGGEITGATGTAATAGASDQAGSGESGGAAAGTDAGGATGLAGTGTGTTGEGASSDSMAGEPQIAALSGFFEIPVEQVMRVCAESPDRSVSDVMREEGGQSQGTGTSD